MKRRNKNGGTRSSVSYVLKRPLSYEREVGYVLKRTERHTPKTGATIPSFSRVKFRAPSRFFFSKT